MPNFTGQPKKRLVNLGDRKPPARNFLQVSRQQRQQREEQRAKDKAARLIQLHVCRYLESKRLAEQLSRHWAGRLVRSQAEFNLFVVDLYFITAFRAWPNDTGVVAGAVAGAATALASGALLANINSHAVCDFTARLLVQSLLRMVLGLVPDMAVAEIVRGLDAVLRQVQYRVACPGLIAVLGPRATASGANSTAASANATAITNLILNVNVHDSPPAFFRYVSHIPSLPPTFGTMLTLLLCGSRHHIDCLSDSEKVLLLLVYLDCHDVYTVREFRAINEVLLTISSAIVAVEDQDLDQDLDLDADLDSRDRSSIVVDSRTADRVNKLYSSDMIKAMFGLFVGQHDEDAAVAISIISTMCHLVPLQKSKLCVLITITPGSYRWFYVQLKSHAIYRAMESAQDYLTSDSVSELYLSLAPLSISNFWKTLYTFEELYSYWLIVSNDFESFESDKLSIEEVSGLLKFVKTLCLTLVLNPQTVVHQHLSTLKDVSISLLNQLYLKNLRLKFLPGDFWHLNHIKFNIEAMLPVIAQEEEDLIARKDMDSDDEEISPIRAKATEDTLAKLEILHKLPFFLKFHDRVHIFECLLDLDGQRQESSNPFMFGFEPKISGDIHRETMLKDAYNAFGSLGSKFKQKIAVTFYNELGGQEAGIDGGGITKEFLTSIVTEAFDPLKHSYFKETQEHQIYPNEDIYFKHVHGEDVKQDLQYLKFLGNIIGKCIYEGVLVDLSFAPFFLNKWCNKNYMKNSINDLASLDRQLFTNLMKLTKMTDEELESLELTFSINTDKYQFALVPKGDTVQVTHANLLNYIHQLSNFKMNTSMHIQSKYFLEGLFELIPAHWLKMFDFNELQMLISGAESSINIEDWKSNVEYSRYGLEDLTIRLFWEVVEEMTDQERSKLVKFVTSVARAPLNGFGVLNPKFAIRYGGDADRLPTASTCVNLLKLPGYRDKETMRSKLLYAINTEAYFDLS